MNDDIYSSAALKKNINARSLTMRVRTAAVLRARQCVARGLCRSRFHSTRRKVRHHV